MKSAHVFLLLPLAGLSACEAIDPEANPYTWNVEQVNRSNIAAEVADPYDLVQGRGAAGSDGVEAAQAVARWRHGASRAASVVSDSPGGQSPGGAGGSASGGIGMNVGGETTGSGGGP